MNIVIQCCISGIFGIIIAFGSIFLKDWLENKKKIKTKIKQNALEVYSLCGQIINVLSLRIAICARILNGKQITYPDLQKDREECNILLRRLDLLIIENFFEFKNVYDKIGVLIDNQSIFLNSIILSSLDNEQLNISIIEFNQGTDKFQKELIQFCVELRKKINNKYINRKIYNLDEWIQELTALSVGK